LKQLVEAVSGRMGVPAQVIVDGECCVPDDVHVALYRIAQEALNNVMKHSHARSMQIELHCTSPQALVNGKSRQQVQLQVSDDGRGFDLASVPSDRLGLGIIRERVSAIGGSLQIDSAPGKGTRITVLWTGDIGKTGRKDGRR